MSDAALHGLMVSFAFVAAAGLALRLVAPVPARFAGVALAFGGWLGLLATVAPATVRERPLLLAGGLLAALVVGGALAHLLRNRLAWLLVAGAVALPLRVPVPLDGETFNLLAPLYAVVGVAALRLLGEETAIMRGRLPAPSTPARSDAARLLDIAVATFTVLCGLSLSWSIDRAAGATEMAVFIVPFVLAYVVVRSAGPQRWAAPAWAFVGTMAVAALVGIYQHQAQVVWQNDKVEVANTYAPNFRTNSIFWDPNIYGRYLVLALLACVAVALARQLPSGRRAAASVLAPQVALGGVLLLGLWYSYSQSSMLALAGGLVAIAVLVLGPRARWLALLALMIALAGGIAAVDRDGGLSDDGRATVMTRGLAVASFHPVLGIGAGAFERGVESLARDRGEPVPKLRASHATPISVLVELGIVGVAAYALLLGAALIAAAAAVAPTPGDGRVAPQYSVGRWAAAATAALVVHSMFYEAYFQDPASWVALALLAGCTPAAGNTPASSTSTHASSDPHT